MSKTETKSGAESEKTPRKRGRPHGSDGGTVSRTSILRAALKHTRTTPLQELSIVAVAKVMGVTPALIHYYLGGRDWLTSGVMNLFYKDLLRKWPEETGNWKVDLLAAARTIYEQFLRYPGIAAYAVAHNRYRLYQLNAFGDKDYGVETLERFAGRIRKSGLPDDRAGIYSNQFFQFIISRGHATSTGVIASDDHDFAAVKRAQLDPKKYPNISCVLNIAALANNEHVYEEGCHLMLMGMTLELSGIDLKEAALAPVETPGTARKKPSRSGEVQRTGLS